MNNMEYKNNSQYNHFYFLDFDLNEVSDYYRKNNLEINNNIINLDKCFNYLLYEKYKKNYTICEVCSTNNKSQTFSIFSLPNILTIILSNNDKIFALHDNINLNKYTKNKGNYDYFLISILCQDNYTGNFILYCYNYKNESWICYKNGKKNKISKMYINSVPLVLVYQIGSTMDFEYKNLEIEDKLSLFVSCTNGISKLIYFHKNFSGQYAYEKVAKYFNFPMDKITLLINAEVLDKKALLSSNVENGDKILVILKK